MELLTIRADLFEKISKLNLQQQQQLLEVVDTMLPEQNKREFDFERWMEGVKELGTKLEAKYGANHFGRVQDILDEVREERLNDLTGGR